MATSVVLKACGGLSPYTWSKTGNVNISSTGGTKVTVTASGAGGGGTSANFYLTFTTVPIGCETGECASYTAGGAYGMAGAPFFQLRTTDCDGNVVADGCSIVQPDLTLGSTNINCGDCSGTLSITANGSCIGSGCTASNLPDTITVDCGSNNGVLDHTDWLAGRNEYLIIAGGSNVTGSTVTVTDDAGVSVTYTF